MISNPALRNGTPKLNPAACVYVTPVTCGETAETSGARITLPGTSKRLYSSSSSGSMYGYILIVLLLIYMATTTFIYHQLLLYTICKTITNKNNMATTQTM